MFLKCNLRINNQGQIIHIDFGFVFGFAPGKQFSMETAPWKMTDELLEPMKSPTTQTNPLIAHFKQLCTAALAAARKHSDILLSLMEIMIYKSNFPSLLYNKNAIEDFKNRLMLNIPDSKLSDEIEKLFNKSVGHTGTYGYDQFQLITNGISP